MKPFLTCTSGTNADLFPSVLAMYVPDGTKIADVTYGHGVFWKNVDRTKYRLKATDLSDGVDFTALPYGDDSFGAVVLDPPYMNGGSGVKQSLNKCYRNPGHNSYEAVLRLYLRGILEAYRVLERVGVLIIKCQPCIADHVQKPIHVHLISLVPLLGFRFEDEFVLHADAVPMMRHKTGQQHARKNHSYFLVFRKIR